MPSYMSLAGGNAQSDQTNTQKRTTDYKMDIMMMIKQTLKCTFVGYGFVFFTLSINK